MLNNTETIEVERYVSYDEGRCYYSLITSKRTPKYKRVTVPRELWERYARAQAVYCDAVEELEKLADQMDPRQTNRR